MYGWWLYFSCLKVDHLVVLLDFILSVVGEDDGGVLFTPDQYETYKEKVLPMVSFTVYICLSFIIQLKIQQLK